MSRQLALSASFAILAMAGFAIANGPARQQQASHFQYGTGATTDVAAPAAILLEAGRIAPAL